MIATKMYLITILSVLPISCMEPHLISIGEK
jgi:hypothetical protein